MKTNYGLADPLSMKSQTTTAGPVVGVAAGVSGSICPQITVCGDAK